MKARCDKCNIMARWNYMLSHNDDAGYYCDDCVPRGCSCNLDPDTNTEDRDEFGRLLPCCEYHYSDDGYDDDKPLDDSDRYGEYYDDE